jgi:hypothetical protein
VRSNQLSYAPVAGKYSEKGGVTDLEPTTWDFSGTDPEPCLQTTGGYGLGSRLGGQVTNAPFVFRYAEYRAAGTPP